MILGLKGLTKKGICKDLGSKEPTKFQILEDMGLWKLMKVVDVTSLFCEKLAAASMASWLSISETCKSQYSLLKRKFWAMVNPANLKFMVIWK